jgi:hypothetical protein
MRLKLALIAVAAASAFTALPASAQAGYYGYAPGNAGPSPCAAIRKDNQVGGAILGGILGGVLGSNVAARGHRDGGTAVGAVVGGLLGSEIGRGGTNCSAPGYVNDYPRGYAGDLAGGPSYTAYPPVDYAPPPPPIDDYRDDYPHHDRIAPRGTYSYNPNNDDYAGRDCDTARQTTRLPDGSVITRPVRVCRDAYYGDWRVRD